MKRQTASARISDFEPRNPPAPPSPDTEPDEPLEIVFAEELEPNPVPEPDALSQGETDAEEKSG